jgi:hypothetical protein
MKLILRIVAPAPPLPSARCRPAPCSSCSVAFCVIELRITVEIRVASELHAAKIRVTVIE